ncbi:hypothetical protein [Bradyrhizobium cenepequi]
MAIITLTAHAQDVGGLLAATSLSVRTAAALPPDFRSVVSTTYASRTNTTISKPAGTADNDILIGALFVGASGTAPTPTAPSGWTMIGTATSVVDPSGFNGKFYLYWKRAASEGASFTFTHAAASSQAFIAAYSGCVMSGSPVDVSSSNSGTGSTSTGTGVTTAGANELLLWIAHNWDIAAVTPPAGMVERFEGLICLADTRQVAAGATGNKATTANGNTITQSPWVARLIALKPADPNAQPQPQPPVVNAASFNIALPASNGQIVGTVTASNSPTSWAITAGNSAGYFAISNAGVVTVTSAGASGLTDQTYNLTVLASNEVGNGSGLVSILAATSIGASPEGGPFNTTRHATTSTFASVISAAQNGDLVLLASGNYGSWSGTNKSIVIAPEPGASPTMTLALNSSAANFTIDGCHTEISASSNGMVRSALPFTSPGISLNTFSNSGASGGNNVTIKRCWLVSGGFGGGYFEFANSGAITFTFDRCFFTGVTTGEAIIRNQVHGSTQNIIVKNCFFYDLICDGVKIDCAGPTVQDCEFNKLHPHGTAEHSDCIQFQGSANGCTIVRNLFIDFEQALSGFDGMRSCTITDNVCNNLTTPAVHWITCGGDNPASTVNHNTVVGSKVGAGGTPAIICGSKPGSSTSITNITNNIGRVSLEAIAGGAAGVPTTNTKNMWSGASSPNINGVPTFVGGANPTTYQGYKLAPGSAGKNAASDGTDVGARIA